MAERQARRLVAEIDTGLHNALEERAKGTGLNKTALVERYIREGLERDNGADAQADVLPQLQTIMQGLVYGEMVRFFREMPLFEGMLANTVAARREAGIARGMASCLFRLLIEHTPPLPCPKCGFKDWPDKVSIARRQERIVIDAVERSMVEASRGEREP